jgi:hypothetical protein
MNVFKAMVELCCVLLDAGEAAWDAADLAGRLQEWWWAVTHADLVDAPPPPAAALNERQEKALEMAERFGRVTRATVQGCCPLMHPEMIRVDLERLVHLGLLEREPDGYYVQPEV